MNREDFKDDIYENWEDKPYNEKNAEIITKALTDPHSEPVNDVFWYDVNDNRIIRDYDYNPETKLEAQNIISNQFKIEKKLGNAIKRLYNTHLENWMQLNFPMLVVDKIEHRTYEITYNMQINIDSSICIESDWNGKTIHWSKANRNRFFVYNSINEKPKQIDITDDDILDLIKRKCIEEEIIDD